MTTHSLGSGWTITPELFRWIRTHLPEGKVILELGSGYGTQELLKYYNVFSVEHDPAWLACAPGNHVIHAPIRDCDGYRWYDTHILRKELPQQYDLLLIDGPPKSIGRSGFLHHLDLFELHVPIIVDDCNRPEELAMLHALAATLNRRFEIIETTQVHKTQGRKAFGVLHVS